MKKTKNLSSTDLSKVVIKGMQEKKAQEITLIDLREIKNSITDYFVICTGGSDTQMDAIADSIDEEVKNNGEKPPLHREGRKNKEWILLDYIDVVVHIFKKESREFYDIESLWGDGVITHIKEEVKA